MTILHICDVSQWADKIVFGSIEKIVIVFKVKSEGQRKREFDLRKENFFSHAALVS